MLAELRKHHVVERHLVPTNRTPVGRVEGEDHATAFEVAERKLLIGSNGRIELGSLGSRLQDLTHDAPHAAPSCRSSLYCRQSPGPSVRAGDRRARAR